MPTVATAGHVDHGKSALVRALTGTDPDRLAEERRRGLTIDLGFAACRLPSGRTLGLVDVPGHERYLPNMLAGAGAVRAALLVVAADQGWRAQSAEHLAVLELLGVGHVVVALTRCDLADDATWAATREEVAGRLAASPVEVVATVATSAVRGDGLDELAASLDRLVDAAGAPTAPDGDGTGRDRTGGDPGRPRLWVDRSFTVTGAGTVVTGTLAGGWLSVGAEVLAGRRPARIRGLQHHGHAVERMGPGERLAVNLSGVARGDVVRGDAVVLPGQWHDATTVDARLTVLPSLDHHVDRRGAWTLHVGAGHQPVRMRVLGPTAVPPGGTAAVRLHLSAPLPLVVGDRFVLRESGRGETVGGGEVLDVDPVLPAAGARPDGTVATLVAERGRVDVDDLARWTGRPVGPDVGRWAVDPALLAERRARLRTLVDEAGPTGLELAHLDELDRAVVAGLEGVHLSGGVARPVVSSGEPARSPAAAAWLAALDGRPLECPPPEGVAPEEVADLRRQGAVLRVDGLWFGAAALERLVDGLRDALDGRPDGVAVAEVRAALGGTRRTLLPFLTWCDGQGVTRRRGDVRVPGPRLHRGP